MAKWFRLYSVRTFIILGVFGLVVQSCDSGGGSSSPPPVVYYPPADNPTDPAPTDPGDGIDLGGGGSPSLLLYPYETLYGDICLTSEATPGCTFSRETGLRITVSYDPMYDSQGFGTDDLWYVTFDYDGMASVFNDLGEFQHYADVSEFAGYLGGTVIGLGRLGYFWEDVTGGSYWLGKNGVLYSSLIDNSNYGQAINDLTASSKTDTSFASLNSSANKKLLQKAAQKLQKNYGFSKDKSVAVATALNTWAVAAAERGKTSTQDMNKTFKAVFGVNFSEALAAFKDLKSGDFGAVQDLTNRSAAALGIKPNQAQKFATDMYKRALSQYGYNVDLLKW